MASLTFPFQAVLFDCDGVLVDSVPITHRVLAGMLTEIGWALTPDDSMRLFAGKAIAEQLDAIRPHVSAPVDLAWVERFRSRRNAALATEVLAVAGIEATVSELHALTGGMVACVSGSDRTKIDMQLRKTGLLPWFGSHVYCGDEHARSKPAPDVYLAACTALDVDPRRCAVIEDSVAGVEAGTRAGCSVFGFVAGGAAYASAEALQAAGAQLTFDHMSKLPTLLCQQAPANQFGGG